MTRHLLTEGSKDAFANREFKHYLSLFITYGDYLWDRTDPLPSILSFVNYLGDLRAAFHFKEKPSEMEPLISTMNLDLLPLKPLFN